jgi:F-type H+-transporting ATPase subunit alpha
MRQVAGRMKLELAQYRELAAFAQFASDLDKATRDQLERGGRLTELLKQGQYAPMSLGLQVAEIWAGTNGHLDEVPVARVKEWELGFARYLRSDQKQLLSDIESKKALDDDLIAALTKAVKAYNRQFGVAGAEAEPEEKEEPKQEAAKAEAKPDEERRAAERRGPAERREEGEGKKPESERRNGQRRSKERRGK